MSTEYMLTQHLLCTRHYSRHWNIAVKQTKFYTLTRLQRDEYEKVKNVVCKILVSPKGKIKQRVQVESSYSDGRGCVADWRKTSLVTESSQARTPSWE